MMMININSCFYFEIQFYLIMLLYSRKQETLEQLILKVA